MLYNRYTIAVTIMPAYDKSVAPMDFNVNHIMGAYSRVGKGMIGSSLD